MAVLRLATWNLLHGLQLPDGGPANAEQFAAAAKQLGADVLALQEVDRGQQRSGRVDQAGVVAEALGADWHRFVPTLTGVPGEHWEPVPASVHQAMDSSTVAGVGVAAASPAAAVADPNGDDTGDDTGDEMGGDTDGPEYGIALVSRLPVLDWAVLRFAPAPVGLPLLVPGQGFVRVPDEPRLAIAAVLEGPAGPFTVAGTHLSFVPGLNAAQLRRVSRWLEHRPRPHVLLGDLNLPGPIAALTTRMTRLAKAATYPSWRPRVQFDHVLARGLSGSDVRAATVHRLPMSDHCALTVDVHW